MARRAVALIGGRAPELLALHLGSTELGAVVAGVLCDLGQLATADLDAVSHSDREPAASRARALLGSMGYALPEHRAKLVRTLDDPDPTFRTAAATGLAHLAGQAPDVHLRGAIEGLRRCETLGWSPLERQFYRDAIIAIEAATCHLKQLPLSVDPVSARSEHLPLPATADEMPDDLLPVPAEDRSYLASRRS